MPCKPAKAKHLLRAGKAEVIMLRPFTIKLNFDTDSHTQPVYLGQEPGLTQGIAAVRNDGKVLFTIEAKCRTDVSNNLLERRSYRRGRRFRKTRYRKARFDNRGRSNN
ncbi:MAG: RRXRR domain-containing protein [Deltaproteobacteria bacterium]|nr:RRXRR domain-containing protein [Deltaproteobacteria bacterium]